MGSHGNSTARAATPPAMTTLIPARISSCCVSTGACRDGVGRRLQKYQIPADLDYLVRCPFEMVENLSCPGYQPGVGLQIEHSLQRPGNQVSEAATARRTCSDRSAVTSSWLNIANPASSSSSWPRSEPAGKGPTAPGPLRCIPFDRRPGRRKLRDDKLIALHCGISANQVKPPSPEASMIENSRSCAGSPICHPLPACTERGHCFGRSPRRTVTVAAIEYRNE